ncbi:L-glutaminase [Chitinophaga terrae (ex Kim and Jung 2007)]|uniref:Glutaminase n=1 Tax=Chitinophaga terrae (ex Kim and Jung 2007) TaxID=408074 RepID=A0A1H4GLF8_9BACT|nr:glutaminase A [Chitinophaga terrae (ex Kim and Jung 2007)]MDQ0109974.1 glutaminase [Chitinophaga terrae (ex Kim and Jung 2007)]GEP93572.1 glutaminase [Chitinophaga terrae (ex Kim and Jung 2007)]SEB10436.1 L-glutaminase [Chitinophaga terrae (ex Kim and Jung 2007)]
MRIAFAVLTVLFLGSATTAFAQKKLRPADYNAVINEAYNRFKDEKEGKNADYIPFLAKVDPGMYGIVLVTKDGQVYQVGETKFEFGIESIEKVFTLCMAMELFGDQAILDKIGADQTGLPFNSVPAIEIDGKKPSNPLVNAGAMATTSLLTSHFGHEAAWEKVDDYFAGFAGRRLKIIDELYKSEAATNEHNQAIAMLLKSYGYMYDDPLFACDFYTRQCSYGVNAHDLALMAGTLANGGVNPVTKERLIQEKYVPKVLAIMGTTGLYETTGQWMYKVGLPSKSGVGGGIISVMPGRFAIAVFSPPLDKAGNSVRAQEAIKFISDKLNANVYIGQ